MNKHELQRRTKQFALRVLKLIDALPRTPAGRAISNQLVRSAMSVGANYRAACRARSRTEFAAKLGIVLEEADESLYWLEMIRDGKLLPEAKLSLLLRKQMNLPPLSLPVASRRRRKHLTFKIIHLT